jgi:hypothetical protein
MLRLLLKMIGTTYKPQLIGSIQRLLLCKEQRGEQADETCRTSSEL